MSGQIVEQVVDVFERAGEQWIWLDLPQQMCWMRDSNIVRPENLVPLMTPVPPVQREFDVSVDELGSRTFRSLAAAGLIEVFEPEPDVVGVRMSTRLDDPQVVPTLLTALEDGTRDLEAQILEVLRTVPPGARDGEMWTVFERIEGRLQRLSDDLLLVDD